jgi:ATP-dependent exoDNAse (exonuclease V) beta subunit
VAASAGSGKTRALSDRYTTLLLEPTIGALPRNILAITFTNAATEEMKDRIILSLKEKVLEDSPFKNSANEKLEELLVKYSDFKVQTIDSFLATIVKSSALELGLSPQLEVIPESISHLNLVLDELFSHTRPGSQGKDKEITDCFLSLLNELLQTDPEIDWDIRQVILKNISELRQRLSRGQRLKEVFSYKDVGKKQKEIEKSIYAFLNDYGDVLVFKEHFTRAAHRLLKEKGFQPWESEMFLKESVTELCKKGSLISDIHQEAWEKIQRNISSLVEVTAHRHFAPFASFLTMFEETMRAFKAHQRIVFVEELSAQLKAFLTAGGAVPEIYFHLGDRISHFLIDEFQDTSRLQWESLFPLIEEALSRGGSLFYVGDKKQSIYGFRGGESALFDEAKGAFPSVEQKNIKESFPEINYRSRKNIISFINKTFSIENLTLWMEYSGINKQLPEFSLETYTHSRQKAFREKEGGLVRVEKISPGEPLGREELDAKIGERLIELIQNDITRRFSPRDIAILARKNTEASWVTRTLSSVGIPIASEKTLNISSNCLVQEIISLLTFLDSPPDNLSFACFISGDVFREVTALTHRDIFSFLLHNRKGRNPLYVTFRDMFPEVWEKFLAECFQAVGFLPPYDLLCRILRGYDVFRNFPDDEGFFYQLLEAIKISEGEGSGTLKAFLDLWHSNEEKKEGFQVILPEYTDAIKVMTIHKAKGLGFPVVIIPFAYLDNKPIQEVYGEERDNFIPYRLQRNYIRASPMLKKLYQEEFTMQLLNEINAFYVAVSRAESELYIFLSEYKSRAGRLPPPIVTTERVAEIGYPLSLTAPIPEKKKVPFSPPHVSEWQERLHRLRIKELAPFRGREAQERGIFTHKFLSRIIKLSKNWKEEIEEILPHLEEGENKITPLIKRFLSKKEFKKWFFLPDDVEVFCEKEIVDGSGIVHRVDRLLVSLESAIIIEFKCGEGPREEHKEQVITYLKLLKEVFLDKNIEGWLVYVDEMKQEKILWAG